MPPAGAVTLEPVPHVEVLLEVVPEREEEERASVRGQLHRRREPALDDGEVAGGQVPIQVVDVRADLEARRARAARRIDPRPRHDDHPQPVDASCRLREASITRRSRCPPTPEPPTVTMQTRSSGA